MNIECLFCHRGPQHGVTVFRVNAKGQPGVWACEQHIRQTDGMIDPVVKQITEAIEQERT